MIFYFNIMYFLVSICVYVYVQRLMSFQWNKSSIYFDESILTAESKCLRYCVRASILQERGMIRDKS
jgi:hypothetical protein